MIAADAMDCPECGSDWRGDEIAEERRRAYGGATHFRRVLGISDWDGIYGWMCPDCHHQWIFDEKRAARAKRDFG